MFVHQVSVAEFYVRMTPAMLACQRALLDLINACIKELVRVNPAVSTPRYLLALIVIRPCAVVQHKEKIHNNPTCVALGQQMRDSCSTELSF